jgi:hypothetical protein
VNSYPTAVVQVGKYHNGKVVLDIIEAGERSWEVQYEDGSWLRIENREVCVYGTAE